MVMLNSYKFYLLKHKEHDKGKPSANDGILLVVVCDSGSCWYLHQ